MLLSRCTFFSFCFPGAPRYPGAPEERRGALPDLRQQGGRVQAQQPQVQLHRPVQRGLPEEVGRWRHGPQDPAQAGEEAEGHRGRACQEGSVLIESCSFSPLFLIRRVNTATVLKVNVVGSSSDWLLYDRLSL